MSLNWVVMRPLTTAVWGLAVTNGDYFFLLLLHIRGCGGDSNIKSHAKTYGQQGDGTTTFTVSVLRMDAGGSRLGHKIKGQTLRV